MPKKFHIFKVYFDRRTERATPEWFAARFELFRDYTLRSLLGQTEKDWTLWIHCDPGMEEIVAPLRGIVPAGTVFTFEPYGARPIAEFRAEEWIRLRECDYVYVTRIDSDDVFAPDVLAILEETEPAYADKVEALLWSRGYTHDLNTGAVTSYVSASPPFHTLVFPRAVFLDPDGYRENFVGDHSKVRSRYPCRTMPEWKFTVLIHGHNFLSTFDYGRDTKPAIERGWNLERFLAPPVVFDLDDFDDATGYETLVDLDRLKQRYPNFAVTLFTIPEKISPVLLKRAKAKPWIEIAVHGVRHEPNEELKKLSYDELSTYLRTSIDWSVYTRGFRPPGWFLSDDGIRACNENGMWVALHDRDKTRLGPRCVSGYYACGERLPYWHGHTHDVCGNWLRAHIKSLLKTWTPSQTFSKVSDAVLSPQRSSSR